MCSSFKDLTLISVKIWTGIMKKFKSESLPEKNVQAQKQLKLFEEEVNHTILR